MCAKLNNPVPKEYVPKKNAPIPTFFTDEKLVSNKAAAETLGLTLRMLKTCREKEEIACIKCPVNGRISFHPADLRDYLLNNRHLGPRKRA